MEFRTIEHTADIGIEVKADSLEELFEGAALAMFSLIVDPDEVAPAHERRISLEAGDREELMFMWLNELLFILDSEEMLFSRFEVESLEGGRLEAVVTGEELDLTRHHPQEEIKAATYHEMEVARKNGRWVARVIFDV